MGCSCFGIVLVMLPLVASADLPPDTMQRINRDVQTVLERTATPGASVLVIQDGRVAYRNAFGQRDVQKHLPAGNDTHYEIGSITKQFTAAAILQLQNAGRLNIDDKVSLYLPQVPHATEVTLRQLLAHTSGIPDYFALKGDEEFTKATSFAALMELIRDKPLDFPPGSRVSYSNTGYIILGRIIEVTSHQSYHQYRREHLLKPARMSRTYIVPDEPALSSMATGYRRVKGRREAGLTIHDSYSWSAGDLVSTVDDLQKWNEALTNGRIVPRSDYEKMAMPQVTTSGDSTGTGLGLFIDSVYGQPRIGHTGGSFGFTAANFYYPGQKLRVIVLSNNAADPEPGEIVSNVIFGDLYPELTRAAMQPAPDEDLSTSAKARSAFEALEQGSVEGAFFSTSLEQKMKNGLSQRMADQFGGYGTPTAFVFKGRQAADGKSWSDYLIECGPGSTLKFSVAIDGDGKVSSLGFNRF